MDDPHTRGMTARTRRCPLSPILLTLVILSTSILPPTAESQLVSGRFVTSVYTWEGFDTVGVSERRVRAFESIQLSVAKDNVSLHTSMLGTANVVGSFGDVGRIRFSSLYLRISRLGGTVDANLGRQSVYAGAGIGTIDGLVTRVSLFSDRVVLSGFGGATVTPDFGVVRKNIHGNLHYGGQLLARPTPGIRIGASYSRREEERDPYVALRGQDTTFTPVPVLIEAVTASEEIASGDVSFVRGEQVSVFARYDHDLLESRTARIQGSARLQVVGPVSATIDFLYRTPRIAYNSIFAAFVANPVREIEGGLEYRVSPRARAFGRVARVMTTDEPSHRWTVGLNTELGTISYAGSDGYAGELQAFSLHGAYPLMNGVFIPSAGVAFSSYRFSASEDRRTALSLLGGMTVRPGRSIAVDLQGQLLTNPVYKNDLRLQGRLTYWFAERLSIF